MTQEPTTLYKLIILYMLNRSEYPMTTAQISDFLLGRDYTNFMTLQIVISDLTQSGLIKADTIRNRTHLSLTEDGQNTLSYFENRISDAIKDDVKEYFRKNRVQLRNAASIRADYYRTVKGEFEAELCVRERGADLINLKISVPTEELAASICEVWQKKNGDIYQYLLKELLE